MKDIYNKLLFRFAYTEILTKIELKKIVHYSDNYRRIITDEKLVKNAPTNNYLKNMNFFRQIFK